jgi:hypothetical protein
MVPRGGSALHLLTEGRQLGAQVLSDQSIKRRVLASGGWRVFSAVACIWSRSACSRRQSFSAFASRGELASAAAVTASIWAASSASSSSGADLTDCWCEHGPAARVARAV